MAVEAMVEQGEEANGWVAAEAVIWGRGDACGSVRFGRGQSRQGLLTSDLGRTFREMPIEETRLQEAVLMTAGEVGALLGVPASWVYEQSRLGRIPTVTLGRYRRYRRAAIEAWVAELEAPPRRRSH